MSAEVGQFALILALLLALVQSAAPLWGAHRRDGVLMAVGRQAALLQGVFVIVAFASLAYAYAVCDFSVSLVAQHSHTTQPLAYRLAATWGALNRVAVNTAVTKVISGRRGLTLSTYNEHAHVEGDSRLLTYR